MAPPFFALGEVVITKDEVHGRLCLGKGYRKITLPPGKYTVLENSRNENYWHIAELSDGYTYRIMTADIKNPYRGKRISVWQNDLAYGLEKADDEQD